MVSIVRSRRCFDVRVPPAKKTVVASHLVPTVRHSMTLGLSGGKKRRICIEVHGVTDEEEAVASPSSLSTSSSFPFGARPPPSLDLPTTTADFHEGDHVVIRVLKHKKVGAKEVDEELDENDDGADDTSSRGSSVSNEGMMIMEEDGFVQSRKYDLDAFVFDEAKIHKTSIEVTLGRGSNTEVRDIKFTSTADVHDFYETMKRLKELEAERAQEKVQEFAELSPRSLVSNGDEEQVSLLVEIASATDLPAADLLGTSDPYVIVFLGQKEVHRTEIKYKTLNPIWSVDSGSLLLLQVPASEFFKASAGLAFQVNDSDLAGKDDVLGHLSIPHHELLNANGDRIEYPLEITLKGSNKASKFNSAPRLNLRVRNNPTEQDVAFMRAVHKHGKNKFGVFSDETNIPVHAVHAAKALHRDTKKSPTTAELLFRVKPGPDPDRPVQETKWLTKEQIAEQSLQPSTRWIETGSGSLGRLYLEVLSCKGLPNMDAAAGGALLDKTDAFCSIIYEDAVVNTEVVYDELSPRWMPWTQRAFVFHMEHPSSQIHLGVFDYDSLKSSDPIGRVSIDIPCLCPRTEYVLTYNLYRHILLDKRPPQGTVTVRLRMDVDSRSQVLTALTTPPPANFVTRPTKEDLKLSRFTTSGKENLSVFDMNALVAYVNELTETNSSLWTLVVESVKTVFLWRGHYKVSLFGLQCKLPVHSLIAFALGVFVVEDYDRFPSFLFFSMAWLMLATNEHRQRHPSPWEQSPTFAELWLAVLTGRSRSKRTTISPLSENEIEAFGLVAVKDDEKRQSVKKQTSLRPSLKKVMNITDALVQQEEEKHEEEQIEHIETKASGGPLHMFNVWSPILLPVQEMLDDVCVSIRVGKSFLDWSEPQFAFILCNACILAGFALLYMPWGWLLRWALRTVVWTALGPWMKLVDILIVRKLEAKDDNAVKRALAFVKENSRVINMHKRGIQIRKETAASLRANKRFMFGEFLVKVPQWKAYRFPDKPLLSSEAKPYDNQDPVKIVKRTHGQRLVGTMIPTWGDEEDDAILAAKAKVHQRLAHKANPVRLAASLRKTLQRKGNGGGGRDQPAGRSNPLSLVSNIHHSLVRNKKEGKTTPEESETGFSDDSEADIDISPARETDSLLSKPASTNRHYH